PSYEHTLSAMLEHPSVRLLGHRNDVPELMRQSDVLVLPSIEEGFPLVCAEAIGSGCVPVVSEVCAGICRHEVNALVHPIGAVDVLTDHITALDSDRQLLRRLRDGCLRTRLQYTWGAAAVRLVNVYREVISSSSSLERRVAGGCQDFEDSPCG